MCMSVSLLKRLMRSEGFRSAPYVCPAGRATIGYGHNLEAHPDAITPWDRRLADETAAGRVRGQELVRRLAAAGMVWSREEAENQLRADVAAVTDELSARCPAYRHLINLAAAALAGRTEGPAGNVHAARARARAEVLIDMAFNLGLSGLLRFRDTLARVSADDYEGAASAMMASRWAGQVGRRASDLARIMRTGEAES